MNETSFNDCDRDPAEVAADVAAESPADDATRARRRRDAGFTLTELMVTVLIIGLLSTAAVLTVFNLLDSARTTKASSDIRTIATALDLYRASIGRYPGPDQGLAALTSAPAGLRSPGRYPSEGFMPNIPLDPWGYDYIYDSPGQDGKPYDLYSLGADGQPGGEGLDADISVWSL